MPLTRETSPTITARHACHCGKSFARKEHLTRHQATHNQPAHVCDVCQRRFSRRELLRRHVILHDPKRTRMAVSCETCRANKTKCSGGTPCSLCARRGIDCTFRTTHGRSEKASISDGSTNRDADSRSMLPKDTPLKPSAANTSAAEQVSTQQHDWLRDLSIVHSEPPPPSDFHPFSPGIGAIYELLLVEKSSLEPIVEESRQLQEWLVDCLKTYLDRFHLRWPVLNVPSFDATTAPLLLTASTCVIGTWLGDNARTEERLCALRIHKVLLQRLALVLIDPAFMSEGHAWPIELLEAVLLTLIFTLYHDDKTARSSAILLQSAFVTILRDKGVLDAEMLADHLKNYFSGSYVPYTLCMREKFRRLIALTYQFDVYFALAHDRPPILHHQEIGADMTSTFALWNAHPLDVYEKRLLEEPTDRPGFRVSAMTNYPCSFKSSQLLVEDVMLGLCGILQAIWVFTESLPSQAKGYHSRSFHSLLVTETLEDWKTELDKLKELSNIGDIISDDARYLLLAYRGENDSVVAATERITTLVQDGTILYYYLKMRHHINTDSFRLNELVEQTKYKSKESRQAARVDRGLLVSALQILRIADSTKASRSSFNPLFRHALILGATLIRRGLTSRDRCGCRVGNPKQVPKIDFQQWIETGGFLIVDGTRFCACESGFWIQRFERAIQDQNALLETGVNTFGS